MRALGPHELSYDGTDASIVHRTALAFPEAPTCEKEELLWKIFDAISRGEVRERANRLVLDHRGGPSSQWDAIRPITDHSSWGVPALTQIRFAGSKAG